MLDVHLLNKIFIPSKTIIDLNSYRLKYFFDRYSFGVKGGRGEWVYKIHLYNKIYSPEKSLKATNLKNNCYVIIMLQIKK